jgi:5-methyltetrahydrofolate--homocysteine methyltransferase
MTDLKKLYDAVLNGDAKTARATTEAALQEGTPAGTLVKEYVIPAMSEVGRRFECNDYFVPELLLANRAMKAAFELLRANTETIGCVVIGTVAGDLHDIGKNLVAAMLEGGGFQIVDLGANVKPERFVESVREKKADIVALSALLTTTMPSMKTTIEALQQAGLRQQVKVLIGGAPITQKYADEIGADGYSDNAAEAVKVAKRCLGK